MSVLDELTGRDTRLDDARAHLEDVATLAARAIEHARNGGASAQTIARLGAVLTASAQADAALARDLGIRVT